MPDEKDDAGEPEIPLYLQMVMDKNDTLLNTLGGSKGLGSSMEVDVEVGVKASSIEWRRQKWGNNKLPEEDEVTLWEKFAEQFEDPMVRLLMCAAIVSLLLYAFAPGQEAGGWIEGVAILCSVAIVACVSACTEYSKELKFAELSAARPPKMFDVRRDDRVQNLLETEIVQGDVVRLRAGDTAPVDGIFIEGQDMKVDESAITGENLEVSKSVHGKEQFVISGSSILEGECYILCTGVGINCLSGRAEMRNREKKDATPLQVKLEALTEQITNLGIFMAALTSIAIFVKTALIKYNAGELDMEEGEDYSRIALELSKILINSGTVGITIIVVAVPEGLPLSVTIALAYSMKKMMEDQNLVRHLAACETMGGATQVCSDKTGTLTQNKMTVVRSLFAGERHPRSVPVLDHRDYQREVAKIKESLSNETFSILTEGLIMNSTAAPDVRDGKIKGNKTECAMLEFVAGMGQDITRVRERLHYEKTKAHHVRHTYPFNSQTKRMMTLLRSGSDMRIHVKGASELVLLDCDMQLLPDGKVVPMTAESRTCIQDTISEMARMALRTLLVAYHDRIGKGHEPFDKEMPENTKLTFVAILAIEDPMRPEVPEAVATCKKAGITVRMVTGDNKATAIAIAKQAGIYTPKSEDIAMEGFYFRQLDKPEQYDKMTYVLSKLTVLARMTPLDKQILVQALRQRGEVVAVTGDGTNDAPALKLANVGFAMMTGTEVAKGASDIILMDDNFASVVTAAMWGRNINDNIRKFIQFQSTVNVAAVLIAFIGSIQSSHGESPLKPVQLLWLNLIMDSLAALALATERPTRDLLDRPPNFAESPLISRRMWMNIIGQSIYQIGLQIWLLNDGFNFFMVEEGSDEHMTIIFNVFVLLQVINEFNARKIRDEWNLFAGLSRSHMFLSIVVLTMVVQIAAVQSFGAFMGCVPLTIEDWQRCLMVSSLPLPIGVLLRLIPIKEPEPPAPKVPEYVETFARDKRLYDPSKTGAGLTAFRQAGKEVIQQIKISASLSTLRRRKRTTSRYGFSVGAK